MSESIYTKISGATVKYLNKNLYDHFYANDFTNEMYSALLNYLFKLFTKETTISNLIAVERGFREYFSHHKQEIDIRLSANSIKLSKVLRNNLKDFTLDRAIFKLTKQLQILHTDKSKYEIYTYLYQFPKEILEEIKSSFTDIKINEDDIRKHIREKTEDVFKLHTRDIILFYSKNMYIRLFVPPQRKEKGVEQRFEGYDPEKLKSLYEERFTKDFSSQLISMVPELEDSSLNFSILDNISFHQKVPDTFRSFVDIAMLPYVKDLEENVCFSLNAYILRLHFDDILAELAHILMQKVFNRDKNADNFLKYYNGETVLNNKGQKIKKKFIKDSSDNIWNYSAIFSIITQYNQSEKNLDSQQANLDEKEEIYNKTDAINKNMQLEYNADEKTLDKLKSEITELRLKYKNLKDRYEKNRDKEVHSEFRTCAADLKEKENVYDNIKDKFDVLSIKLENSKIETNNRKQHYEREKKNMKVIESSFERLNDSYDLIQIAIAKAIIGR